MTPSSETSLSDGIRRHITCGDRWFSFSCIARTVRDPDRSHVTPSSDQSAVRRLTGSPRSDLACGPTDSVWPNELEMRLVTAGRMLLSIEDRAVTVGVAMLAWVFPGQPHRVLSRSPDLEGWTVQVGPGVLRLLADDAPGMPPRWTGNAGPTVRRLAATDQRWLFLRLEEMHASVAAGRVETTLGLAHLLARAWRVGVVGEDPYPAASAAVLHAVRLLDRPGRAVPWTATRLARTVGVSPGHLARRFRAETGRTLTDYRQQSQLDRYLDLSDDDHELSITEAAYAAGFGSYAQFHRVFVRSMGTSPSGHRIRRRAGTAPAGGSSGGSSSAVRARGQDRPRPR